MGEQSAVSPFAASVRRESWVVMGVCWRVHAER
jgi:hypothetical protein